MIYLHSFKLSSKRLNCPNIYPYNVFRGREGAQFFYDLDSGSFAVADWTELENVRYFYDFFKMHDKEFE